jgi:hypothetical protein
LGGDGRRIVDGSDGFRGCLTYGPFALVPKGHYRFAIRYRAKSFLRAATWDVVVHDPDPRRVAKGRLTNTDGEPGVIRGEFSIDVPVGRGLEVRTFFPGTGRLEIMGVDVSGPFERCTEPNFRPVSQSYGFDRGQPIDRFYMGQFLFANRAAIAGSVVEVGDPGYSRHFGGRRVSTIDVLSPGSGPEVSVVADLRVPDSVPEGRWDCFICTQVLVCLDNFALAAESIHRALRPGGVALVTLPTTQRYFPEDIDPWPLLWGFSPRSAQGLFGSVFGYENVVLNLYGNAASAAAFLGGYAAHEIAPARLAYSDPTCPVIIGLRVTKND